MLLQLKPLFMGEIESLPIDAELDFSGVEFQGIHPFYTASPGEGRGRLFGRVVTRGRRRNSGSTAIGDRCNEAIKGRSGFPWSISWWRL